MAEKPDELGLLDEDSAPSRRAGRLAAAAVAVVVVMLGGGAALALTGGGSEDDPTAAASGDGSSLEDTALDFAECVRDNGIEDYPVPQIDVDEDGLSVRIDYDGPITDELEAAEEECRPIIDAATPERERATPEEVAELQDQVLALAQCMSDRGYADFPVFEIDEFGEVEMDTSDIAGGPGGPAAQFEDDLTECLDGSGL